MCIAAAIVGGSLGGATIASSGAKSAAKKQVAGQQSGVDEQRRQFDITRADLAPSRQIGNDALNQLAALYGIPSYQPEPAAPSAQQSVAADGGVSVLPISGMAGGGVIGGLLRRGGRTFDNSTGVQVPSTPDLSTAQSVSSQPRTVGPVDYSRFYSSPDYQFALTEGLKGVENSAAARGGLYSGNAMRALQERGAGIASQQYGNYVNRLAALAGIGQSATQTGAQLGAQMSGNVSNLLAAQGDARASGIAGSANAWGSALGTIGSLGYDYLRNRSPVNSGTQAFNYRGGVYGSYA